MKTLGVFEYDNLFAGEGAKEQICLPVKSSVARSDLARGTLLAWINGADGGLVPLEVGGTGDAAVPFAVLAEDLSDWKEGAAIDAAPVFISGCFNVDAVTVKSGTIGNDTIAAYARIGIRLVKIAK